MKWKQNGRQTDGEERANSLTHAIGAGLGAAGLAALLAAAIRRGDPWQIVSYGVYGVTVVLLYSASVFYHAARSGRLKRALLVFDQAAIYLLIAGTYTPFTILCMRGSFGWTLFGLIWLLALTGITLNFFLRRRMGAINTSLYLAMGWLVIVAIKPLLDTVSLEGILLLLAGGLAYTIGLLFLRWDRLPYAHTIWHLFVLAGSVSHYVAIYLYVLQRP